MKKFLKKSSVFILILAILVSIPFYVFATNAKDDTKCIKGTITASKVVAETGKNVLKKSKTTKKNYSNTIRVLVTPKQKQAVQKKLKTMNNEIEMLAKVIYRESRGDTKMYKSAVAWSILNRVDAKGYGNTIQKVITAPNQFCWIPNTPVYKSYKNLAKDVVTRWLLEKKGCKNVGRTLPKSYKFFTGDGVHNYFRKNFNSTTYWSWQWGSPY